MRKGAVTRKTKETDVSVSVDLDGSALIDDAGFRKRVALVLGEDLRRRSRGGTPVHDVEPDRLHQRA